MRVTVIIILTAILVLPTFGAGAEDKKRVAVLYFDDHSHFNSSIGHGYLPSWLLKWLFGSPKDRKVWDLREGFRRMLNEKLAESGVYEPVSIEEIESACRRLNVEPKDLSKHPDLRARLAEELDLDAMVIGDVLKFDQERLRGIIGGKGIISDSTLARMRVRGYLYIATVVVKIRLYDRSGEELSSFKIGKKASHHMGTIDAGPIKTIISDMGLETRFGRQPITSRISKEPPIVEKEKLDEIEFASPEYHKTLFGIASDSALEETVYRIRQEIGPLPPKKEQKQEVIEGKVVYVSKNGTIFVNVGSEKGVTVGMRFEVFSTIPLVDPDTGDMLGQTTEKVGVIEITEVESGKLSRAKAVEGGDFKKGDLIRHSSKQDTP